MCSGGAVCAGQLGCCGVDGCASSTSDVMAKVISSSPFRVGNDRGLHSIFQSAPTKSRDFSGDASVTVYPKTLPRYCPSVFCIAPASTFTAGPPLPDWQTFACSRTFSRMRVVVKQRRSVPASCFTQSASVAPARAAGERPHLRWSSCPDAWPWSGRCSRRCGRRPGGTPGRPRRWWRTRRPPA